MSVPAFGGGVGTRAADTLLVSRAADFLAAGPSDARTLIAHVCQIPAVPEAIATHMAAAMFADYPRFARDAEGRWCLQTAEGTNQIRQRLEAGGRELGQLEACLDVDLNDNGNVNVNGIQKVNPGFQLPQPAASSSQLSFNPLDPGGDLLSSLSWSVVDVETTGTSAFGHDRVTEIAAVVVRNGEIAEVFETLVNPQRPIPPWITRLTRITWDMVKDAPTFGEICDPLLRALDGNVFVAHNARFDWGFVSMEVERATGRVLEGRQLCTVRLARKILPQLRSRSLDYVARHYGVEIEPHLRHRATGDAVATARVLLRLLDDARDRGVERWSDLDRLLAPSPAKKRPRRPSAMPQPVSKDTTA